MDGLALSLTLLVVAVAIVALGIRFRRTPRVEGVRLKEPSPGI